MIARVSNRLLGSPRRALLSVGVSLGLVVAVYLLLPPVRELGAFVTLAGAGALFLVHTYPNETKQQLGRFLTYLAWTNSAVERESVRQDIEGTVSAGVEELARACPDGAAARVRIEFVRSAEDVSELADGTLVLGIAQHKQRSRNLVAAAWAYARHGVLRSARTQLDRDVSRGIDFTVAMSILSRGDSRAVTEFIRSIWEPAVKNEVRLKELAAKLERVEEDKLFAPILLEEFATLGTRLVNRLPTEEVAKETAGFVEHLFSLADGQNELDRLNFEGRWIRCGFVLLGTSEVLATKGVGGYVQVVLRAVSDAYPRIYLMARGKHIDLAQAVGAAVAKDPRVLYVRESRAQVVIGPGVVLPRMVSQVRVDVREYVGIGQQPIVSVGDTYERTITRQRRGTPRHVG